MSCEIDAGRDELDTSSLPIYRHRIFTLSDIFRCELLFISKANLRDVGWSRKQETIHVAQSSFTKSFRRQSISMHPCRGSSNNRAKKNDQLQRAGHKIEYLFSIIIIQRHHSMVYSYYAMRR